MIRKLYLYISTSYDPYENLAIEQHLTEHIEAESCILYLWQNENTVVIGKNQNPWSECRCALLEEEGGTLARRSSGGGAVFHDKGNLNYTFICPTSDFNTQKNLDVIEYACALAGIETERSGRNDLLANGRKFSGTAFYHANGKSYQHGTLLIHTDLAKLERYLSPPRAKLEAKGIASVSSRVVNLSSLKHDLTCDTMRTHMITAFEHIFAMQAQALTPLPSAQIRTRREALCQWDYLYGKTIPFTADAEGHFTWGHARLLLKINAGKITESQLFTDAMDSGLPTRIQTALQGCPLEQASIADALAAALPEPLVSDFMELLKQTL